VDSERLLAVVGLLSFFSLSVTRTIELRACVIVRLITFRKATKDFFRAGGVEEVVTFSSRPSHTCSICAFEIPGPSYGEAVGSFFVKNSPLISFSNASLLGALALFSLDPFCLPCLQNRPRDDLGRAYSKE